MPPTFSAVVAKTKKFDGFSPARDVTTTCTLTYTITGSYIRWQFHCYSLCTLSSIYTQQYAGIIYAALQYTDIESIV